MINKILRKIFKYLEKIDGEMFQQGYWNKKGLINIKEPQEEFFIKVKKRIRFITVIYLDCFHLFNVIITLIIFIILWKYDIQLISIEVIMAYKYLLYYAFIYMLINLIIDFMKGLYNYIKNRNTDKLKDVLFKIIRFFSFIINVYLIMWIFKINFFVFLQYNIIFLIANINMLLINLHGLWGTGKLKGKNLANFASYPWLIMLLIYILYWMNIQEVFKVIYIVNEYCWWELSP